MATDAEKVERFQAHVDYLNGAPEFVPFPKIGRLKREIIITEKIDGTNGAIHITDDKRIYAQSRGRMLSPHSDNFGFAKWVEEHKDALIFVLGPGLHYGEWWGQGIQRGYGLDHKRFSLFNTRRWRFDGGKLNLDIVSVQQNGVALDVVPLIYSGPWTDIVGYTDDATKEFLTQEQLADWPEVHGQPNPRMRYIPDFCIEWLAHHGSFAAPGWKKTESCVGPEGIVIYHHATQSLYKQTIDKDDKHKGEQ